MNFRFSGMALVAVLTITSCSDAFEDNTGSMGVYDETDGVYSVAQTYEYTTRSIPLDSVISSTTKSYFGQAHDPSTGVDVRAEFLSQFHTFENYKLPDTTTITSKLGDSIVCDSVILRLYFSSYYGSATNPLKMAIYELDTLNVVREDSIYYSTIDLESYMNPKRTEPLTEKVFTAIDYTVSEARRSSSTYYNNIYVKLPREYGTSLLRLIAKHPKYVADSYQFNRHVCPGFYFKLKSGSGTIMIIDVSTLDIYYKYYNSSTKKDEVGLSRFSATPEVIQSTRVVNTGVESKAPVDPTTKQPLDPTEEATYVLSPAGIGTEVTLPVDKIYENHELDSISRARIILTRYNSSTTSIFGVPSTLLMLRKSQLYSFFEKKQVPDGLTSFTVDFNSGSNTYTFSNIGKLISVLYHTKQQKMKEENLTSDQYNAAYPDWNKVLLTPVTVSTNKNTGSIVSVRPDFSFASAALVGGKVPLQMHVIFSRKIQ